MSFGPSFLNITCGHCGHTADAAEFMNTPVCGELPSGQFQCPKCKRAWQRRPRVFRQPWEPYFECAPIEARL